VSRGLPAWGLLLLGCGVGCRGGAAGDPSPFVGSWAFVGDAMIKVTGISSEPVAGRRIKITATSTGLELDVGCQCLIPMTIDGDHARSVTSPAPSCTLLVHGYLGVASINEWTLDVEGAELVTRAKGNVDANCTAQFEIQPSRLVKGPDILPHCGGDDAVGVLYYSPFPDTVAEAHCPVGAQMEPVDLYMDAEDIDGCTATLGDLGEPLWTEPESPKTLPGCPLLGSGTWLYLCRVDGKLFTNPPVDPRGGDAGYAVLSLGSRCPAGSLPVVRHLSDEGTCDRSRSPALSIAPNAIANPGGPHSVGCTGTQGQETGADFTDLHFCLFEPGPPAEPGAPAAAFPDLGFPYAVFHDFDGPQPPWVISKRWMLNDDETTLNQDSYDPAEGPATDGLRSMVEAWQGPNGHLGTLFEIARVR